MVKKQKDFENMIKGQLNQTEKHKTKRIEINTIYFKTQKMLDDYYNNECTGLGCPLTRADCNDNWVSKLENPCGRGSCGIRSCHSFKGVFGQQERLILLKLKKAEDGDDNLCVKNN